MRVLSKSGLTRSVSRPGPMAVETNFIYRLAQLRVIFGPMHVVAIEAGDAAPVHHTLHKIISLHAVLVRGAVGEVGKSQFAKLVIFQLPEIPQIQPNAIPNRPVIIFSLDRIAQQAVPANGTGYKCRWR